MANGKNGNGPAAAVARRNAAMSETELLEAFKSLGETLGAGEGSWEKVAYKVMEGVECNTWSDANFKTDRNNPGTAGRILNAFYDGAALGNKRLIRPLPDSDTFTNRVSNIRAIGKAAALHDAKFRGMLQGTNGLIDGVLANAIKAKQSKSKKADPRILWGAFEAIYRAAVRANKKTAGSPGLTKEEIDECIFHPVKPKPEAEAAFVDAVGRMIKALKDATQGYTSTKGADKGTKVPAIFVDKELTDALKSLTIWHGNNSERGSKKQKSKDAVNFKTMSDAQMDILRAQFNAELKERKAAAATA